MSEERTEDRLLRIAREAGYDPTGCERPGGGRDWFLRFAYPVSVGAVRPFCVAQGIDPDVDPMTVIDRLKRRAGPENQPDAVRARKLDRGPCDTRLPREEHQIDPLGGHCVKCLRTGEYMEATRSLPKPAPVCESCGAPAELWCGEPAWSVKLNGHRYAGQATSIENALCAAYARSSGQRVDTCAFCNEKTSLGKYAVACRCKTDMVDAIISAQCAAGGVDTEGSRHEAERWCAWLCQCVCEGMRATTEQSALRLVRGHGGRPGDGESSWVSGKVWIRGEPLGRP